MRILELEITNWEKHNPRSDVKTARWFKMSNEFFGDPEFYTLSVDARVVWIYLLCVASKTMSSEIKINTQMIADQIRLGVDSVDFAILNLEQCKSIKVKPVTLVNSDLQSERKDKVTSDLRALEERREEEKREEKNITTEHGKAVSVEVVKNIIGPIKEFSSNEICRQFLKTVPQDTQKLWLQTYQDTDWLIMEFIKMVNWLKVNPRKAPKSKMERFISGWLTRGWDSYRKTIPASSLKLEHRTHVRMSMDEMEEARQLGIM